MAEQAKYSLYVGSIPSVSAPGPVQLKPREDPRGSQWTGPTIFSFLYHRGGEAHGLDEPKANQDMPSVWRAWLYDRALWADQFPMQALQGNWKGREVATRAAHRESWMCHAMVA